MIRIFIQGLKDGLHEITLSVPVSEVPDMFLEFFGNIEITGTLRVFTKRYTITGKASCQAKMICDYSLEEFIELIEIDLHGSFLADDHYAITEKNEKISEVEEHIVRQDDKYLDITSDLREDFAVNLPMKRIAPKYRDKDFSELYPQYFAGAKKENKKAVKDVDDRWEKLKKIKLN